MRVLGSRKLNGVAKERTLPELVKAKMRPVVKWHEKRLTRQEAMLIEWLMSIKVFTHDPIDLNQLAVEEST